MKEMYVSKIMEGFPYPVVASFRKLRTDEYLDPGPQRLKCIQATAEAISRFLGMVVLCECRDLLERKAPEAPLSLVADFGQHFRKVTWGNWIHFTREGLKWLDAHRVEQTMPELLPFYFKKVPAESNAAAALGKLLKQRNGWSHDRIKAMHAGDFQNLCGEAYELLEEVLEAMEFLLDYKLTFISQIEVNKRRKSQASFLHRLSMLIGSSDAFPGDRKTLESFLDSSSVLLINSETQRHLNLDPLLVYEASAGKAPDIFFYNGMKNPEAAEYIACHHGKSFKSADSSRGKYLAEELKNLVDLFTAKSGGEIANGR
ncbi:MAG: hypothetical protein ACLQJ7_10190 [Syntrophobacteraceae bacterium]